MTWLRLHTRQIWLSAVHALALFVLTLVWMNLSWEFGDEVAVASINQIARYEVLNPPNKVVEQFKKDLLLINTTYDKTLIPYEDDYGSGYQAVTNREQLSRLLDIIVSGSGQPALVVVDLLFDSPSSSDSALQASLRKINNLVVSSEANDGVPLAPWPGINFALAQYETTSGTFLKYRLVNDTLHYLPAAMLRETHGTVFNERFGLVRSADGWWLNSFIVDLPIRKAHLDNGEILMWNLGDALQFNDEDIRRLTANKIIIVGDFYRYDLHYTLLGEQPGPLIVANAYLGMLEGIPRIKALDCLLVFLLYFFSTMYVVVWRKGTTQLPNIPMFGRKLARFFVKYLSYLVVFSLYSIFLYLLTSRHFQLLLFGLYFNLFEYLYDKIPKSVPQSLVEPAAREPETSNVE
jgi:hypothetical protein